MFILLRNKIEYKFVSIKMKLSIYLIQHSIKPLRNI